MHFLTTTIVHVLLVVPLQYDLATPPVQRGFSISPALNPGWGLPCLDQQNVMKYDASHGISGGLNVSG